MHKCTSSNIDFLEYDDATKTLKIAFKNGGIYSYDDVDQKTFDDFKDAKSAGSHFAKNISGKFAHKKYVPHPDAVKIIEKMEVIDAKLEKILDE